MTINQILHFAAVVGLMVAEAQTKEPALGVWNAKAVAEWWQTHPEAPDWQLGAGELHLAMLAAQEKHGVEAALKNQHFIRWVMHLRWLSLLPDDLEQHKYFSLTEHQGQFGELGRNPDLLKLVSSTLVLGDDRVKVAEILCRIASARPGDFNEYIKLAVAMAVVCDAPPPAGWPHPYVERDSIPVGDQDPAVRFGFIVDAHRREELLLDPRQLSVRELCFVVDSMVELRELAYAQQVDISSPRKLEDLYFAIKYDDARIQGGRYQWPHGSYRLIDVGKKGGICADQAYFVSQVGKAKGVPTVVFMGQGISGTHAWVGFMHQSGTWEFEAARFRGEKYPVGVAYDPQTWKRVTDAQLAAAIKEVGSGRNLDSSRQVLQWAMLNEGAPFYRGVVAFARRASPRSIEAWEMESAWLASNERDLAVCRRFWVDWVQAFDRERDLKIRGQKNLLRTMEQMGDQNAADRLRDRVLAENRSSRFDLGISLAADAVFEKVVAGDWEAAASEYEDVMRRFKRRAGGHLFYNLVQPYVNDCLQEGRFALAEQAVKHLLQDFGPQAGSILDNDMRQLISSVAAAR